MEITKEIKKDLSLLKHLNTANKMAINKNIKEIKKGNISPNPVNGIIKKENNGDESKTKTGDCDKNIP